MERSTEPLTISYLNHKAFKECKRLWVYRYAPGHIASGEVLWEVIREGRLLPMSALLGRVVDDVITAALRFRKRKGLWPSKPTSAVRRVLGDYMAFSEQWVSAVANGAKWPRTIGKQAIDRIYYGDQIEAEELEALITRGEELVARWFDLPLVAELDSVPINEWRVPAGGATPHFLLGDIKVFARPDFMLIQPGKVRIFDWKTGDLQRGAQDAREQLLGYADYARHAVGARFEEIELLGVWLSAGFTGLEVVDENLITLLEDEWKAQISSTGDSLRILDHEPGRLDAEFPLTSEKWRCQSCVFRCCSQHPRHDLMFSNGMQKKQDTV